MKDKWRSWWSRQLEFWPDLKPAQQVLYSIISPLFWPDKVEFSYSSNVSVSELSTGNGSVVVVHSAEASLLIRLNFTTFDPTRLPLQPAGSTQALPALRDKTSRNIHTLMFAFWSPAVSDGAERLANTLSLSPDRWKGRRSRSCPGLQLHVCMCVQNRFCGLTPSPPQGECYWAKM